MAINTFLLCSNWQQVEHYSVCAHNLIAVLIHTKITKIKGRRVVIQRKLIVVQRTNKYLLFVLCTVILCPTVNCILHFHYHYLNYYYYYYYYCHWLSWPINNFKVMLHRELTLVYVLRIIRKYVIMDQSTPNTTVVHEVITLCNKKSVPFAYKMKK